KCHSNFLGFAGATWLFLQNVTLVTPKKIKKLFLISFYPNSL
ncbi:unnamed protein product, partial [marine sediment metagenome]